MSRNRVLRTISGGLGTMASLPLRKVRTLASMGGPFGLIIEMLEVVQETKRVRGGGTNEPCMDVDMHITPEGRLVITMSPRLDWLDLSDGMLDDARDFLAEYGVTRRPSAAAS